VKGIVEVTLKVTVKSKNPNGMKTKYSSLPVETRVEANVNIEYTRQEIEDARRMRKAYEFHKLYMKQFGWMFLEDPFSRR
jgi:hypothetical protein